MNPALHDEIVFTCKEKIPEAVFEHKIPSNLILNFDQTFLGFTNPSKRNSRNVPIANSDDKRETTGMFTINLLGEFLSTQLI